MVLLMLCLHLNSFAQHISMQLKNVTVKQAIETIQKQNGYSFTFAASDLNTQKIITVTARNLPIEKVVEQILIGQNVSYTVQGKDIIIKKKSNQATQQRKKVQSAESSQTITGNRSSVPISKKKMVQMGLSPILTESFSSLSTKVVAYKYLTWDI